MAKRRSAIFWSAVCVPTFVAILVVPARAEATSITVTNTYDWNVNGTGVETFTEPTLPSWSHFLTFTDPVFSFTSAELTLRHMGNVGNAKELWVLYNGTLTQLVGNLQNSGNSTTGNSFVTQTFAIPTALYPIFNPSVGSWTLVLKVNEAGTDPGNQITLDYATLTVTYDDGSQLPPPAAVPEPASLLLLGTGLAGLAAIARRRRRA